MLDYIALQQQREIVCLEGVRLCFCRIRDWGACITPLLFLQIEVCTRSYMNSSPSYLTHLVLVSGQFGSVILFSVDTKNPIFVVF